MYATKRVTYETKLDRSIEFKTLHVCIGCHRDSNNHWKTIQHYVLFM